jgi:hypothetical protein
MQVEFQENKHTAPAENSFNAAATLRAAPAREKGIQKKPPDKPCGMRGSYAATYRQRPDESNAGAKSWMRSGSVGHAQQKGTQPAISWIFSEFASRMGLVIPKRLLSLSKT